MSVVAFFYYYFNVFRFVDQGGKSSAEVKADVMTDGEWQFVTATYSSKTGLVKLYRNAEEVPCHSKSL